MARVVVSAVTTLPKSRIGPETVPVIGARTTEESSLSLARSRSAFAASTIASASAFSPSASSIAAWAIV